MEESCCGESVSAHSIEPVHEPVQILFKVGEYLCLYSPTLNKICLILMPYEISNNVVCATSKGSDQPAHTCSLTSAFARRLNIL